MNTDWVEVAHDPQAAAAEIDRLRKLEFWAVLGSSTIRNYGHLGPQEALEAMIQDAVADRTAELETRLAIKADAHAASMLVIAELERQLAEAKASAEAWQENCRLTEEELEKERDKHASTIGKLADANRGAERNAKINRALADKLAERDDMVIKLISENASLREEVEKLRHQSINWVPVFDENMVLQTENAALREEVERLKVEVLSLQCPSYCAREADARKHTAAEILDLLTQEEIRRITSVGDPRVTTISSKLLAMMAELRQRYGLEG